MGCNTTLIVDNIVHGVQHNIVDNIVHGVQHNIVDNREQVGRPTNEIFTNQTVLER